MVVLGVYKYGASFVANFLWKVLKNGWVQVDPPCAQTGVKSSLGTLSVSIQQVSAILLAKRRFI